MNLCEYEARARATRPPAFAGVGDPCNADLAHAALGLTGEAGEVADTIKKHLFQLHPLDADKVVEELGDVMWYVAYLCDLMGVSVSVALERNIAKLSRRYPSGHFSVGDSIARKDQQDGRGALGLTGNRVKVTHA
jgi:NTP pyrophosphatase (non-canonical NTP hydrolase)